MHVKLTQFADEDPTGLKIADLYQMDLTIGGETLSSRITIGVQEPPPPYKYIERALLDKILRMISDTVKGQLKI